MSKFVSVTLDKKKYTIPESLAEGVDKIMKTDKNFRNDGKEETPFEWQTDQDEKLEKSLKEKMDNLEKEMDSMKEEFGKKKDMKAPHEYGNKSKEDEEEEKKEDQEEEKKKEDDKEGNSSNSMSEGLKKVPLSKVDAEDVSRIVLDTQEALEACRQVFSDGEYNALNKKDSLGMKKEYIKKVSPSIHSSVENSSNKSFVDGVFQSLKTINGSSKNKLDSALANFASNYPDPSKKGKQKVDGTPLVYANTARQAFLNEKNHWRFDSPKQLMEASRKVDMLLEENYNEGSL